MSDKKYELTDETIYHFGRTLYRIRALKDFGYIQKGELGGYIEKEENLSHLGTCWAYDSAQVSGSAKVSGSAWVYGSARVSDSAQVSGSARVFGLAKVSDSAQVSGSAWVSGSAQVYDFAQVSGSAKVFGSAKVSGSAKVFGSAKVYGSARVSDFAQVYGSAKVSDFAQVYGSAKVSDFAQVYGSACARGNQVVCRSYECRSIVGFSYSITILPFHINIGCQTFDICDLDRAYSELPLEEVDAIKVIIEATMADIHRKIAEEVKDKE